LQKFRPVSINVDTIKTAEGSAIVKIGNTVVVCGIKGVSRMQGGLFESWL
jgi:exosome complex component RRP43